MIEFCLNDIELNGDVIKANLDPGVASEIAHYISVFSNDVEVKLVVITKPVRQRGQTINAARREAGFPELPRALYTPPVQINITISDR